jgi:hypothetical protein
LCASLAHTVSVSGSSAALPACLWAEALGFSLEENFVRGLGSKFSAHVRDAALLVCDVGLNYI